MGRVDALAAVLAALNYVSDTYDAPLPLDVQVFPNPVSDAAVVSIRFAGEPLVVKIMSQDGREVFKRSIEAADYQVIHIPFAAEPQGVYFWQVTCGKKVFTGKIFKS